MAKTDALIKGRSTEKKAFLTGVFWLTASSVLVKLAGLMFKIPMNHVVGDTGMGYYNSAYSVYTFLYMLSTSGLPVALSVMVSEGRSRGEYRAAASAYRSAMAIFVGIGVVGSGVMLFFSRSLAGMIRSELSAAAIAVSAPTMLFICVSSALRGYFQGCGNMVPTAVSQFIEAVGKLFFGVGAALYAVKMGQPIALVAAYAASGLTLGSLFSAVYLIAVKLMRGERDLLTDARAIETAPPRRKIIRTLLARSVPVTVSASVMSLSGLIDTALIQRVLRSVGISAEDAATLYGNYTSLAVPLFNLPPALVYPIAYSIVPIVAACFASGRKDAAAERISSALKYAIMIGLPCSLGMASLAEPILSLIYRAESARVAAPLLMCLAPSSLFVCVLAVTNSSLQGCGHEKSPVVSMLCGAIVKCVGGVFFLKKFGMIGAPISTFLCYAVVTVMNLAFVVKYTHVRLSLTDALLKPLFGSVACSAAAISVERIAREYIDPRAACIAAIVSAVIVYAVIMLASGAIARDEIASLLQSRKKRRQNAV